MTRILQDETVRQMAEKIFFLFDVGQSCSILGMAENVTERRVMLKGQMVWKEMLDLDKRLNWETQAGERIRRKRKPMPRNSMGGPWAGKIFKYKEDLEQTKFSIWRIQ